MQEPEQAGVESDYPYNEFDLENIQRIAEQLDREKRNARPIPGRKEKRAAVRAQAKDERRRINATIPDQGPRVWLEEARRKRTDEGR